MVSVQITASGIKKSLQRYKPLKAITEYIWNGFDAKATCVNVNYSTNTMGGIEELSIGDNGYGIPFNELEKKFTPFFDSEKVIDPNEKKITSTIHGKNGVGRLTFFQFANSASWTTVYKNEEGNFKYTITIDSNNLEHYSHSDTCPTLEPIGTIVTFRGLRVLYSSEEIIEYLTLEFCWFLELNKDKNYKLKINGVTIDYSNCIGYKEESILNYEKTNITFNIKYIQWKRKLNCEYSCYYLIDTDNNEIHKETTTLNNKGDHFYHSVYVKSIIFDNFYFNIKDINQIPISGYNKSSPEYNYLLKEIENQLRRMRKPFLKKFSDTLIEELEKVRAFPNYDTQNYFDNIKKTELEIVIREIYQIQPKIFSNLNIEQKKTLVRFLDLIMQSGECGNLFKILNDVIELDSEEREELACLLDSTKMSNIIKTIRLVKDRYEAIDQLKQLVYNKDLKANEVNHLQKFIEKHYWIFGEQYHLVTAAEPNFEEALRRYVFILTGEDKKREIKNADKNKQMDIFAVRQIVGNGEITNVVVELKHPDVKLGEKQLSQVKKYMNVIIEQPEFNAPNMFWEFYLVGNEFNTSKYIEREIESNKGHGERSLVFKIERYKIFVKTWSEIFTEFEIKHKYLNDKLELERKHIIEMKESANSIVNNADTNTAIQLSELKINKKVK